MHEEYDSKIDPKENKKTLVGLLSGTTVSTILMGVNPILGTIGYTITGLVSAGKYLRDKAYSNENTNTKEYFANSNAGDALRLKYDSSNPYTTKIKIKGNMIIPKVAQDYIDKYIKNGRNGGYELVLEKVPNGKFKFVNKLKDNTGAEQLSPVFDMIKKRYRSRNP